MNTHPTLKRAARAAAVTVVSVAMPEVLEAACINRYNPITGIQTITCCGETACCTTTWKGSELISMVCE